MELVAVNHWNTAIATHSANHPTARHIVEDVSIVDPRGRRGGGEAGHPDGESRVPLLLTGKGRETRPRPGPHEPWAVHNWLTKLDVRTALVENVPEFVKWGPLLPDGRPDRSRRGEYFQAWFLTFQSVGYQAEWRMLNAADYGDATTRVRFFLIARRDGRPIAWPEPTHARDDTGMFPGRLPWRGAREIIDWSNPGKSLLDHPKYVKKPLSQKTLARIAPGAGTLRRTTGSPLHPAPRPARRGRRRPPRKQADGGE